MNLIRTTPAPSITSTTAVNTSNNQSHEESKAGTAPPAPAHLSTTMTTTMMTAIQMAMTPILMDLPNMMLAVGKACKIEKPGLLRKV